MADPGDVRRVPPQRGPSDPGSNSHPQPGRSPRDGRSPRRGGADPARSSHRGCTARLGRGRGAPGAQGEPPRGVGLLRTGCGADKRASHAVAHPPPPHAATSHVGRRRAGARAGRRKPPPGAIPTGSEPTSSKRLRRAVHAVGIQRAPGGRPRRPWRSSSPWVMLRWPRRGKTSHGLRNASDSGLPA